MKPDTAKDRNKVLSAIKRKPRITIFEIAQVTNRKRSSVASHVRRLLREQCIQAVQVPACPGIWEIRNGYEIAERTNPAAAAKKCAASPWDVLTNAFGIAGQP
jgi:DNA-binding Lrp family transcriptional regulator